MQYKIGIFGSAAGNFEQIIPLAHTLGRLLSKEDVILITGAGHGIPYEVAHTAAAAGTEIWGFPPTTTLEQLKDYSPEADMNIYKKLFYVPTDFPFLNNIGACRQYRNLTATATADAGIVISGRWGAMSEFTALREMGKTIGVCAGTGGITDELERLTETFQKPSTGKVIFNDDPEELIKQVLAELEKNK